MAALGDELPAQDAVLGEVHVARLQVGVVPCERLALEVARERSMAELVVLHVERHQQKRPREADEVGERTLSAM